MRSKSHLGEILELPETTLVAPDPLPRLELVWVFPVYDYSKKNSCD